MLLQSVLMWCSFSYIGLMDSPCLRFIVPLEGYTFKPALSELKKQIELILSAIEEITEKNIGFFSIGKTYARQTMRSDFLDPEDDDTFTKKGLNSRWSVHKKTYYGKDGMIVLAIITEEVAWNMGYIDAELCALDIERELQKRFSGDPRCIHNEYHQGPLVKEPAEGYPIYMTFSFDDDELLLRLLQMLQ